MAKDSTKTEAKGTDVETKTEHKTDHLLCVGDASCPIGPRIFVRAKFEQDMDERLAEEPTLTMLN